MLLRFFLIKSFLLFAVLCVHAEAPTSFKIEDTQTYVGIAAVKLSVEDLVEVKGSLKGKFIIRVPMMPSKNDEGRIELPLNGTIEMLNTDGGTLVGKAYSKNESVPPRKIVCEVRPNENNTIYLSITTDKRTLNFKSSYQLVPAG